MRFIFIILLIISSGKVKSLSIVDQFFNDNLVQVTNGVFFKNDQIKIKGGRLLYVYKNSIVATKVNGKNPPYWKYNSKIKYFIKFDIFQNDDTSVIISKYKWEIRDVFEIKEKSNNDTIFSSTDSQYKGKTIERLNSNLRYYYLEDDINNRMIFVFPFLKRMFIGYVDWKCMRNGSRARLVTNPFQGLDLPTIYFSLNGRFYVSGNIVSLGQKSDPKFSW